MHHFSWDIVTPSSTPFTEPPGGYSSTRSDSIDSTDSVGSGYLMDTSLRPWSAVVEESDAPSPHKERRSLEKNRRRSTQAILLSLFKRVDMDHLRWFLLGALVCLVSILLSPGQSTSQGIVHHAESTPLSTSGPSHSQVSVMVPTDRSGNENALFKRMVSPTVLTEVVVIVAIQSLGLPAMARLSLLLRRGIPTLMNWMALLVRTLRRVPLLRSGSSLTAVVASSTQSLRTGLIKIVTQGWKQTLHLYKQTAASKAFNRGKKFLKHFFPVHHDDDEE
jgi:hypothetical protein